jgi:glycosyltransferase involved in cell wall biosynthesis
MKILWLAHRDPMNPRAGGAERIIYEVGKRFIQDGHDLTIFSGGWGNRKKDIIDGITIIRFGKNLGPHIALPVHLLKNKYDVIIADLGHAVPWVSPILLRRKTVVSFLHLHARSLPGQTVRLLAYSITILEKLYFIIYKKAHFVTISNTSLYDLENLGIKSENISVINPGVNAELFHPSIKTDYPSLVYFGGMRPYKRPEEPLYLLKGLRNELRDLKLTMIGEGPCRNKLERLCIELGLMGNVVFTGRISDSEVAKIVASSWLNIHSSVTEGWGISIIEAASAGTPTVAFNVPGVSDSIKNGFNGITVENGNRDEFIAAALSILRSPKKWWSSSVEIANKYSWDKTTELWEEIIQEVTDGHHKKPILVKS